MLRSIKAVRWVLAILSLAGGLGSAAACGGGDILFEDTFETLDPTWGMSNSAFSGGPGGLTVMLEPESYFTPLSQTSFYEDVEVCASFAVNATEGALPYSGLAFWSVDNSNYYVLNIFLGTKTFAVYRLQKGKQLTPVRPTKSEAIKQGPGAVNELSVALKGNRAKISINGEAVVAFNGMPPKDGSLVGLDLGGGGGDEPAKSVTIRDFQVRALAE